MDNIKIKIKEIYLPFLLLAIGTIVLYNSLRWMLDIRLGLIPLKEDILNIWLPIVIPWIPILIWLRKRLRILDASGTRDNGHFFYQMAMVAAITVPLIISQNYIEKASFDLIEVESITQVQELPKEKYFSIEKYWIDKADSPSYFTARASGRNNENLNFYLYFACPFSESNSVWYGVEYKESLSNHSNEEHKNTAYNDFLLESRKEFVYYNFEGVQYFEKLGYSDARDGYLEAIKKQHPNITEKEHIILIPQNEKFEKRLGSSFGWIFGSFGIGAAIVLGMVLYPKIDRKGLNNFKKNKPLEEDDLQDVLKFLNPIGKYGATATLILLNLFVFLFMILKGVNIVSPTPQELLEIGGNRRGEVMNGEFWRLLSAVFIHGGLMHLAMNLVGLTFSGLFLEKVIGSFKFFICFILCGILASVASIYWHEHTIGVGASGAIFGLYGIILVFNLFKIYPEGERPVIWGLIGAYAGIGLLFGFLGGIDNAAHFGGLISGAIIGLLFVLISKEKVREKAS